MVKKRLIVFSLLLSVTALYFTLTPTHKSDQPEPNILAQDEWQVFNSKSWRIDYLQTDEQQVLDAQFMRQQEKIVYIDQPLLKIIKPDQLLILSSQNAQITDQNLFDFNQQVVITQHQLDSTQNSQLETEFLQYNQLTDRLTTDLAVTLTAHKQITTGVGLSMQLKEQKLNLLSEVKTYYEP